MLNSLLRNSLVYPNSPQRRVHGDRGSILFQPLGRSSYTVTLGRAMLSVAGPSTMRPSDLRSPKSTWRIPIARVLARASGGEHRERSEASSETRDRGSASGAGSGLIEAVNIACSANADARSLGQDEGRDDNSCLGEERYCVHGGLTKPNRQPRTKEEVATRKVVV